MSDERISSPGDVSPALSKEVETGAPRPIELSSSLKPSSRFPGWGRLVLYGAALFMAASYFLLRNAGPAVPRPVFLNTDRITRIEWPGNRARLAATEKGWRIEHESWGSVPADADRVRRLLQTLQDARGLPVPRVPEGFAPAGELLIATDAAERTLRFFRAGNQAVVESKTQRYLLAGFSVDALFPDPGDLAQRRPLAADPERVTELQLPVLTAEGQKHYRIKKDAFYYIAGPHIHLANSGTVAAIIRGMQDVSFRRLLPPPAAFPEKPDFVFVTPERTWKLARFPGSCPDEEGAWVAQGDDVIAGCIPERLMARMVPSLPTLLEPRLVPPPPGGKAWDRIRVRAGGQDLVEVSKANAGWVFADGKAADDALCEGILQTWQNTAVLGFSECGPKAREERVVIFSDGTLEFPVTLLATGDALLAVRWKEGRCVRIPAALPAALPAEREGWADRRVFPSGCRRLARSTGAFREVFVLETLPDAPPAWRVLEPLDLPYPANLQERIERLCALRARPAGAASDAPPAPEPAVAGEDGPVRWEVTDAEGKITVLAVSSSGAAVRRAPDGTRTRLALEGEDVALTTAHWHAGIRPPWDLLQARSVRVTLGPQREIRITFHDPHWLWSEGEKKRILTEAQVRAFLDAVQKDLEQAVPVDLEMAAACPVRMEFSSEAGLPVEYCVETVDGRKRISRARTAGRAQAPDDFPEARLPVFP